jgi:chemotaxis protein MotB
MADKKPVIVIKKITVVAAGGHGGSWKVAFADFMTAMMAFFLVMWLVNQTDEVKKSVAEYFSTPSVIEYNFANFGVELTLEKLFLDLVNEPLKAFEQFVKPIDKTPNVMDMGHKKIQFAFLRNKLGEFNVDVETLTDEITFEIPSDLIFNPGSARPSGKFVPVMERVREIIQGLKDADIHLIADETIMRNESSTAKKNLAEARLDMISSKVESSIQGDGVDIFGKISVEPAIQGKTKADKSGYIKFRIKQKYNSNKPERERVKREPQSEPKTEQKSARAEKSNAKYSDETDSYSNVVDRVSSKGTRSE